MTSIPKHIRRMPEDEVLSIALLMGFECWRLGYHVIETRSGPTLGVERVSPTDPNLLTSTIVFNGDTYPRLVEHCIRWNTGTQYGREAGSVADAARAFLTQCDFNAIPTFNGV